MTLAHTCFTDAVRVLPFVPPTSILASLLNWTMVWVRSKMSWQRSRKLSRRIKRALFWVHNTQGTAVERTHQVWPDKYKTTKGVAKEIWAIRVKHGIIQRLLCPSHMRGNVIVWAVQANKIPVSATGLQGILHSLWPCSRSRCS